MKPVLPPDAARRDLLQRLLAGAALPTGSTWLAACGGGSDGEDDAPPDEALFEAALATATPSALGRLKAALKRAPLGVTAAALTVTQGSANSATSSFGAGAQVFPPLGGPLNANLKTAPQVWGFRRGLWTRQINASIAGQAVYPVTRRHPAATTGSNGVCGLHFVYDGRAFELLFAGTDVRLTLIVNGRYRTPRLIQTALRGGVAGAPLSAPNTFVRIDLGTAALRNISVYARSSQGPCAIAVPATASLQAWNRSREASFAAMADSYGGAFGPNWGVGGPFFEAAAQLRIPHIDLDAIGGTGYAPNNANDMTRNPGNAFPARLPSNVDAKPDLFLTAGGINDNNAYAAPPLYPTAADALAGFNAAVTDYYQRLRTALPGSVLAAIGPWAPRQSSPTDPIARAKADTIKAALQAVGGWWIFLDNLDGSWRNSAGASGAAAGPWQTGTGNAASPAGDGNGDLYLSADGVHPNADGCLYLGTRIADGLRAALSAM